MPPPPPPYAPYGTDLAVSPSPTRPPRYGDRSQSQSNLPLRSPVVLQAPHTAWASTSTVHVAAPPPPNRQMQEQSWQGYANQIAWASKSNSDSPIARSIQQGAAVCDVVAVKLTDLLSRVDGCVGSLDQLEALLRGFDLEGREDKNSRDGTARQKVTENIKAAKGNLKSEYHLINFKKAWHYENSRLPPGMVPFRVYLPTWALISRAAQASTDVYSRPTREQRDHYIDPGRHMKATIFKSDTVDDRKLVIIAIRGSRWNYVDWHVNIDNTPTFPTGFLDDEGNACHAGFLDVARAMIRPVSDQLRRLLEEEPSWVTSSLLFTGHSAGGAVASLLYAHMLSKSIESELTVLAGVFRRIHCINFGVPPITLLPLQVPIAHVDHKNQFLSFVNEGDPVTRADRPYFMSLIRLLAESAPMNNSHPRLKQKLSRANLRADIRPSKGSSRPWWPVPDATLSNAGRLVLLREKFNSKNGAVEAMQLTDSDLRGRVFGDVSMHSMELYNDRLYELACAAISGRGTE